MKRLLVIALLFIAPVALADSIQSVAQDLRSGSPIPFRYGVAADLAENLLDAQAIALYGGSQSLDLSIESVLRAISIDGGTYVGFANVDPITWLQSNIAIDPAASIGFTPSALYFGEQAVSTPEPSAWLMLLLGLVVIAIVIALVRGVMKTAAKPPSPVIMTDWGPTTEWARQQAARNMRDDINTKAAVEQSLSLTLGSTELGLAEARRRYPEAYEDIT